jgi:hypothetical protein
MIHGSASLNDLGNRREINVAVSRSQADSVLAVSYFARQDKVITLQCGKNPKEDGTIANLIFYVNPYHPVRRVQNTSFFFPGNPRFMTTRDGSI